MENLNKSIGDYKVTLQENAVVLQTEELTASLKFTSTEDACRKFISIETEADVIDNYDLDTLAELEKDARAFHPEKVAEVVRALEPQFPEVTPDKEQEIEAAAKIYAEEHRLTDDAESSQTLSEQVYAEMREKASGGDGNILAEDGGTEGAFGVGVSNKDGGGAFVAPKGHGEKTGPRDMGVQNRVPLTQIRKEAEDDIRVCVDCGKTRPTKSSEYTGKKLCTECRAEEAELAEKMPKQAILNKQIGSLSEGTLVTITNRDGDNVFFKAGDIIGQARSSLLDIVTTTAKKKKKKKKQPLMREELYSGISKDAGWTNCVICNGEERTPRCMDCDGTGRTPMMKESSDGKMEDYQWENKDLKTKFSLNDPVRISNIELDGTKYAGEEGTVRDTIVMTPTKGEREVYYVVECHCGMRTFPEEALHKRKEEELQGHRVEASINKEAEQCSKCHEECGKEAKKNRGLCNKCHEEKVTKHLMQKDAAIKPNFDVARDFIDENTKDNKPPEVVTTGDIQSYLDSENYTATKEDMQEIVKYVQSAGTEVRVAVKNVVPELTEQDMAATEQTPAPEGELKKEAKGERAKIRLLEQEAATMKDPAKAKILYDLIESIELRLERKKKQTEERRKNRQEKLEKTEKEAPKEEPVVEAPEEVPVAEAPEEVPVAEAPVTVEAPTTVEAPAASTAEAPSSATEPAAVAASKKVAVKLVYEGVDTKGKPVKETRDVDPEDAPLMEGLADGTEVDINGKKYKVNKSLTKEAKMGFISELDARSHCAYCAGKGSLPDQCGCTFNLDVIDCKPCGGSGVKMSACPACR